MSARATPLPQLVTDFTSCKIPVKRIFTGDDIAAWLESEAYARIMTVLLRCNSAIKGKKVDTACHEGETTIAIMSMLDQLEDWIEDIPLHTAPQRFGNRAFRDWGRRLEEKSESLHRAWLLPTHTSILPELLYYFNHAFGNWTRIDYGSGHELTFLGYLTLLRYTGLLDESDEESMVFRIFERYLRVCRKLQATYRLEPAGSKGVWGLEDHQFLNFLWGSSQLVGQVGIKPADILQSSRTKSHSDSYLFLSSIDHINALKRGPFNEHSPILHNIASTVPSWEKVNSGLLKMYQAEVLEKHPVVQHFWFGSLLPWTRRGTKERLPSSGDTRRGIEDLDLVDPGAMTTKAPWAVQDSSLSSSTTAPAPWKPGSAKVSMRSPSWSTPDSSFIPIITRNAASRNTGQAIATRTLASTGSAAAMSTPMGAISQPATGLSRPSKQQKQ